MNAPERDDRGPDAPASFETALADLAALVSGLESGSLGLSESIAAYERGVALVRRLHEELEGAERRVSLLVGIDEQGRPVLRDADPATGATTADGGAADSPQAPASRPAPRSARTRQPRSRSLPGMDDAGDQV